MRHPQVLIFRAGPPTRPKFELDKKRQLRATRPIRRESNREWPENDGQLGARRRFSCISKSRVAWNHRMV